MQTWNPSMFAEMVKEMAEELSVQGIPVSFSQGELPEAIWKANPFLIRRLIWNLGSNIERYGDRTRTTDIQVYVEGKTLKTVMSNGMGKEAGGRKRDRTEKRCKDCRASRRKSFMWENRRGVCCRTQPSTAMTL